MSYDSIHGINTLDWSLLCRLNVLFNQQRTRCNMPRLRNHNATDDGNVDFQKNCTFEACNVVDLLAQRLLNDMMLDWYPPMNSSLHTRQSEDDKSIRFQNDSFVILTTWQQVISSCKIYPISTMPTLTWEGIEFGDFILIASIHLSNQSIENFMSSSRLGCDFVTSLLWSHCTTGPNYTISIRRTGLFESV